MKKALANANSPGPSSKPFGLPVQALSQCWRDLLWLANRSLGFALIAVCGP
jgi:hypothetical protein